jgi:GNAT superfamily N-acetyltransferase
MNHRDQFKPVEAHPEGVRIEPLVSPTVDEYRFFYRSVGDQIRWRDRLIMSDAELQAALNKPGVSIYALYVEDAPAGYVELVREGRAIEIAYFGLFPDYQGKGLGKYLLSYGIARAWEGDTDRVWVHTCNLDGPHALDNYLKRGFSVYKVHEYPMPERYE